MSIIDADALLDVEVKHENLVRLAKYVGIDPTKYTPRHRLAFAILRAWKRGTVKRDLHPDGNDRPR